MCLQVTLLLNCGMQGMKPLPGDQLHQCNLAMYDHRPGLQIEPLSLTIMVWCGCR
jgi:hypothetical protein